MKYARGFTLLELMIVVAVVAILAIIAIPAYNEQVRKSKRSDAIRGIAEIQLGLEKYRASCSTYASQVSCLDRTGNNAIGDAGDAAYPTASTSAYYTFGVSGASATGYTVTATKASSFSDPKCGNFIITNTTGNSVKSVSSGTSSYCWKQ